ncbi:MAG: HEAT repeat domain-containing protein [Endomicrobiia bacterium]
MKSRIIILLCLIFSVCYALDKNIYLSFIRECLNSKDVTIKTEAIRAISYIGDKSSINKLKELLNDPTDTIKIEASLALHKLGDNSGKDILIKILKEKSILSMKDSPVKRAKALAKNLNRAKAAKALGEINAKSAIPILKEIAEDKNEDGRVIDESIISLIKLGDRSKINIFLAGLNSSEKSVKEKSCEVLGEVKEEKAKQKLKELLSHWDKGVRAAACTALGKIGDKESIKSIINLLSDKEDIVRMASAESLGFLGDTSVIPHLKKTLDDPNGMVRLSACESLYKLGDNSGELFVISSLNASDTDAKIKSIQIISDYKIKNSLEKLETLYQQEENQVIKIKIATGILNITKGE